jgi:hypothetical protein
MTRLLESLQNVRVIGPGGTTRIENVLATKHSPFPEHLLKRRLKPFTAIADRRLPRCYRAKPLPTVRSSTLIRPEK